MLVDDPSDGYVLLFGGYDALGAGWLGDTWTTTGGVWTRQTPTTSPSVRSSAAAAYDPALHGVVLFGGYDYYLGSPYLNDTWLFKAGNWSLLSTPVAPSVRSESAIAYDPALQEIVLFGGTAGATPLGDTWTFGSGGWTQVSTSGAPPPLNGAAMAYDANTSRLVMFGGSSASSDSAASWSFNGTWSQLAIPDGPDGRYIPAMTTLSNGTVLLSGGLNRTQPTPVVDAWEISGSGWVPISAGSGPNGRVAAALAYDSDDGYALFFGGRNDSAGTSRQSLNDSWAFDTLFAQLDPFPAAGIAPFTIAPTATVVGGALNFDGSSSVGYGWNFGDGTTSIATAPSHTYNLAGTRSLGLGLRDAFGLSLSLSTTITVGFHLNLTIVPLTRPELTYSFSATPMNATAPVTLSWHFGDGALSTLSTPTHTYGSSGLVTVTVQGVDGHGASGSGSESFTVPLALLVHLQTPGKVVAGSPASFSASASGGAGAYVFTWNFSDGSLVTGDAVTHTFGKASIGNLTGGLNVRDANGTQVNASFPLEVSAANATGPGSGSGSNSPASGGSSALLVLGALVVAIGAGAGLGALVGMRRKRPPNPGSQPR